MSVASSAIKYICGSVVEHDPAFNDCEMHFGVGHGRWSNGERVLVDNDEVREFPCFQPTELIINPTDKRRVPCVEVKGVRNLISIRLPPGLTHFLSF